MRIKVQTAFNLDRIQELECAESCAEAWLFVYNTFASWRMQQSLDFATQISLMKSPGSNCHFLFLFALFIVQLTLLIDIDSIRHAQLWARVSIADRISSCDPFSDIFYGLEIEIEQQS